MGRWCRGDLWFLWALVWLGVLAGGCSRGSNLPPLAEVSGTVTLDGQALPGARIEFIPESSQGTKGPPALGVSDDSGNYELTTLRQKGAAIGPHQVKIVAERPLSGRADKMPRSLIPARYNDPGKSGFSFDVKIVNKGEKNEFNLPLTSKPQ